MEYKEDLNRVNDHHIRIRERDWRAFKIYMDRMGFKTQWEAFMSFYEIRSNQPPINMIV